MMVSGLVTRQTSLTAPNKAMTSLRDYGGVKSPDDDRVPGSSSLSQSYTNGKGWQRANIWGNGTLNTAFNPSARETPRTDTRGYRHSVSQEIEGKTGSGSLVASSESDHWSNQRTPWNVTEPAQPISQRRASSVSPVSQVQPSQAYVDTAQGASQRYSVSRGPIIGQSLAKSGSNAILDPTSGTFVTRQRPDDSYGDINRMMEFQQHQRSTDSAMRPWTDAQHLHSPTEDRRSVANSEYFSNSSAAQSRSGSLPPSRHGSDPVQYPQPNDTFARFPQPVQAATGVGSRGHTASISAQGDGRFQERSDSFQGDVISPFGRMALDTKGSEQTMMIHRNSLSSAGQYSQVSHPSAYPRQVLGDIPQNIVNSEDVGASSYTPEGYPTQFSDQNVAFRNFQFANRGALTPNADFRSSPYYSTSGTPPAFDHLYPSRNDQNARAQPNGHSALLDRKLRNVQQEQQALLHSNYQQMLAAQFRDFPYPYGMHLGGMTPGFPMHMPTGMVPTLDAVPKGPRDQDSGQGLRSAMLDEFKHNGRSKRYELKDIYDHICEFSGDQHGSRFIQQKLETANSDEKERVFKEIQPNAMQLMTDVFGNYVIQKFFEHGDQNQKKILANRMKGSVLQLSLQMYGCRVVQKALEHVLVDQQASMVKELEKNVLRCVKDQNGNHVIQKAIERVPAEHIQFIIDDFIGHVSPLSVHGYGCRVIQRMLEHCEDGARRAILTELHACASTLVSDQYGNYVTQHIIEHGDEDDRAKIINFVTSQVLNFAKHKFASNVVEKCLVFGTDQQRHDIMMIICQRPERGESALMSLIKDGYGNYVVQKLLDTLNPQDYAIFMGYLCPEMASAKRVLTGNKQIQALEKKMHRFGKQDSMVPDIAQRNSLSPTSRSAEASLSSTE